MSSATSDRTTAATRVHAFTDDALADHDATALAELIRRGEVSPAEAVEAAIARSEAVEEQLTALERTDFERARARARTVDPAAADLAGVPTLLKDNVPVAGLPMTAGSRATPPQLPVRKNGKVVEQLLATGLVPIGTSRMPEFGWTPTTERADGTLTRNPWHTDFSAGGSSGGSAAYVAAGVVPIAHGNDGGGSIRIPAAACGLVGLKPTRGRLRIGESSAAMPVRIVSDGVLTRTVRDVATFYAAAEQVYRPRRLPPVGRVTSPPEKRLRVGLLLDSPVAPPTDAETRSATEDLARTLESLGHHVEPYDPPIPDSFREDFIDYWSFLAMTAADGGPLMFGKGFDKSALDPMTLGLAGQGRRRVWRAPLFLSRLRASGLVYDRQLRGLDLVLSPVLTRTTPRLGELDPNGAFEAAFQKVCDYAGFTPLHNATGAPAISLPTGRTSDGRPIGVMLSAARGADALLIQTALEVEQAVPFARIQD